MIPPGYQAPVVVSAGEERGVGAAEPHGHAETLAAAHGDAGAELARRPQQGQGEQVRGHRHRHARGLGAVAEGLEVDVGIAFGVRVLQEGAEVLSALQVGGGRVADLHLPAAPPRPGPDDGQGLGVAFRRREEPDRL